MRSTSSVGTSRRGYIADAIIDALNDDRAVGLDTAGPHAQAVVAAYTRAFERILGAPARSLA
jgi:hypothetical protein